MPTEQEFEDLRAEVARLTALVEQLYYRSNTPLPTGPGDLAGPPPEIVEAIEAGNLILAIKLWRERTGLGLAEAKAEIDELARRMGR